ncbi:hypothetical protein [Brevundimonas lenta]|uniref:Uncharacterized protein n=1 Tax=Brevundimonas lenta TaxID=424796 RepID=A0A7W6JF33_9CAUL|nr:hypothetical protein [Brevundimonas lenta]MBB4083949.1 hypothetical protein [Brevundimonas lenta]
MPPIRTDRAGFGMLVAGASVFIFLCTVPAMMTIEGMRLHMDALLFSCLRGGLAFGGAFVVGHLFLRRAKLGNRALYAGLGGLALALAYATQMRAVDLAAIAAQGMIAYFFILPTLVGAGMGFLYAFKAGWEIGDDSPEALVEALQTPPEGTEGASEAAVVRAGETEYFTGPLQVRTSLPLMLLAATLSAGIAAGVQAVLMLGYEASLLTDRSNASVIDHTAEMSLGVGLQAAFMILIAVIPVTLSILVGHFIARGLKTHAHWAYFAIGLLAPVVLALVSLGALLMLGVMIALPTALGLLFYRSFAGLEPVPVREDIRVGDTRALIPADHPRRQFGRIIRSQ